MLRNHSLKGCSKHKRLLPPFVGMVLRIVLGEGGLWRKKELLVVITCFVFKRIVDVYALELSSRAILRKVAPRIIGGHLRPLECDGICSRHIILYNIYQSSYGSQYCSEVSEIGAGLREGIGLEGMRSHGSSRHCSLAELSRAESRWIKIMG
ncbi:hypothetical protein Tco_0298363 [Tanacetum coccineum]